MGAPKGNRNALKHGLYAKHYTAEELAGLRKMRPDNYEPELGMIRTTVKNVYEIHAYVRKMMDEAVANHQPVDVEALAKITNSLSTALTALNTTARTQALFTGTDTSFNDDFEQALNSLPVFLDDKYLREEKVKGEILVEEDGIRNS
jgi:uncharacterized protein YjcR